MTAVYTISYYNGITGTDDGVIAVASDRATALIMIMKYIAVNVSNGIKDVASEIDYTTIYTEEGTYTIQKFLLDDLT